MLEPFIVISRREGRGIKSNHFANAFRFCAGSFAAHSLLFLALLFWMSGCAVRKMAINSFADALTEGSATVYASDDDPELIGEALPFSLKTTEALLQSAPEHRGLLLAAASGFVQYGHAYVLSPAKALEFTDLKAARKGRQRAKRLFLRARDYGLRTLELSLHGVTKALQGNPREALSRAKIEDVPALYWTAAAWGSAISVSKDDMALVADLPVVEALLKRALELDESWGEGAIHEFFVAFAMVQPAPGAIARAEKHFQRALELKRERSISPLVTFAESVCVHQQDRARFKSLLSEALAYDVDRSPENRLANILAQRKASGLLNNIDHLFFVDDLEVEAERKTSNLNK